MRILVVIDSIHLGGISTSLMPLLQRLTEYGEVDLLAFKEKDMDLFHNIPSGVNVLKAPALLSILASSDEELKSNRFFFIIGKCLGRVSKYFDAETAHRLLFAFIPKLSGYDIAISYRHDEGKHNMYPGCNDYVRYVVKTKTRVTYIHTDMKYSGYYSGGKIRKKEFDYIVCVSEGCKKSFDEKYPHLKNRTLVCENFVDSNSIIQKSLEPFSYNSNKLHLFSACRLSYEKAIPRALRAIERLKDLDSFEWHIAGDGPDRKNIEDIINSSSYLKKHVFLMGQKNNPYPCMRGADVFFLPSLCEASPVTFSEARVLGIPILTTETCSSRQLVADRNLGIVCKNSEDGIYDALSAILQNKQTNKQ